MVLSIIGLVMVLTSSSITSIDAYKTPWHFFIRQSIFLLVGLFSAWVTARVDFRFWYRTAPYILLTSTVMLVLVLVPGLGVSVNGSTRWLGTGSLNLEPSQLATFGLIIYGARLLGDRHDRIHAARSYRPLLIVAVVTAGLLALQPDTATTIIVVVVVFTDLLIAGVARGSLVRIGLAAVAAGSAFAIVAPDERRRLTSFLHPTQDTLGANYQTFQGLLAVASGGVFGTGLGGGFSQWGYLPNAYTDYIFAIIAQQTGLVGGLIVVALYVLLAYIGVRVVVRAPDRFSALVAAGITAWLTSQAVLNIGGVVAILPVTGVPLPFVSYGGTSLVVLLAAIGVLVNIASQSPRGGRRSSSAANPSDASAGL